MPFHFCSDELIAILTLFSMLPGIKFAIARLRRKKPSAPMKPDPCECDSCDTVSREEAADALGRAGRIDTDRFPVADIIASGAEVGISPDAIREGIAQAKVERGAKASNRMAAEERWKDRARVFVMVLVAGVAIAAFLHGSLSARFDDVEAARARVHEAVQRQAEVRAVTQDPAELLGAENRVSIARRRYDTAASSYNSWLAPRLGLLAHVPYSNEIRQW